MSELGQTTDPVALVPGSVSALADAAVNWRSRADAARVAAEDLGGVSRPEDWTGEAADLFASRLSSATAAWSKTAQMLTAAADALDDYVTVLGWAQQKAGDAIEMWETARAQTAESLTPKTRSSQFYGSNVTIEPLLVDAGASLRAEAVALLEYARQEAATGGNTAADAVRAAADIAPPAPDPWQVASTMAQLVAQLTIMIQLDALTNLVNGTASFGNALIQHPETIGEILGGAALAALGGSMMAGGGAVSLTGAGALAGAPAAGAGWAVAGTGVGLVGAGITSAGAAAAGDSRVGIWEARGDDRGDGRDDWGWWAKGQQNKPWVDKEKQGLDELEHELQTPIERGKAQAYVAATTQRRFYDGVYKNPDGTYTAVEVKSGSAFNKYLRNEGNQLAFDQSVTPATPARVRVDGEWVQVVHVELKVVP